MYLPMMQRMTRLTMQMLRAGTSQCVMATGLRRREEDVTFDEVQGKDRQREIDELHVLTESVQDGARLCLLEVRKGGAGERQYALTVYTTHQGLYLRTVCSRSEWRPREVLPMMSTRSSLHC